jgi:flagellar assembly factor FliW
MKIRSRQFGQIKVADDDLIRLAGGLVGFEDVEEFAVVRSEEHDPFAWLIALDDPDLAFAVADPDLFIIEPYQLGLGEAEQDLLAWEEEDPIEVLLLVSPCAVGRTLTANLKAPIVVNWRTRLGRQLVLYSSRFSARQPIPMFRDRRAGRDTESFRTEVRIIGRKAA